MMRRIVALLLLLASGSIALGAEETRKPITVPRAGSAPVIDGKLTDTCWESAALIEGFSVAGNTDAPPKGTEARICFDEKAIYLAVFAAEPEVGKLRIRSNTRNS